MQNRAFLLRNAAIILLVWFIPVLSSESALKAETTPYGSTTALSTDPEAERMLDEFMKGPGAEARVPGAVVAVVRNGQLVLLKGYGDANLEKGRAVDPERTFFRIGSISKTFVALAALQLMEEGKFSLETNVAEILPELGVKFEYPVKIQHLVTHTAGFDDRLIGLGAAPDERLPSLDRIVLDQYPGQIAPPGEFYNYSNYGLMVLAAVVEKTSNMEFGVYQRQRVFDPLGMEETSFFRTDLDEERVASSYSTPAEGPRMAIPPIRLRYFPAGSVFSTGAEMGAYLQTLVNGFAQNQVLSARSFETLKANHYRPTEGMNGSAFVFYERRLRGERFLEHSGDWEAFGSILSFSPERRSGIFFSMNGSGDIWLRDKLMARFADYLGMPEPDRPSVVEPSMDLAHYEGSYRYARYEHFGMLKVGGLPFQVDISVEGNSLQASFPAGLSEPMLLQPIGEHLFMEMDSGRKVLFDVEDGEVEGLSSEFLVPLYLERISFWEGLQWLGGLMAFSVLAFLSCLFLPVARKLFFRFRDEEPPVPDEPAASEERRTFRLLVASAWAHVLFLVGTQLHMGALQEQILEGVPGSLMALLYLPYGLIALVILLALRIPKIWNAYSWGGGLKTYYTLVVLAGVIFFQVLWYLNLVAPVRS